MKAKRVFLIIFGMLFLVSPAHGTWWELVAEGNDGTKYYTSTKKMKRISKDLVRAWVKHEYKTHRRLSGKYIEHASAFSEYDCEKTKWRKLKVTHSFTDGSRESWSYENEKNWLDIVPDTVSEDIFNLICGIKATSDKPGVP